MMTQSFFEKVNNMALRYSPFQASGTSELPPNQTLTPGQYLQSENGRFRLTLQSDGNLVIKEGEAVVWIADNHQPYSLTLHPKKMREPLQFVISNNGFLYDPSRRHGVLQMGLLTSLSYFFIA
jgi:hypothetical protein